MTPQDVGQIIKQARELKRWSQESLAREAGGVGQSTIDRIEKGQFKRMPSDLPAICAALGIPLPDLDGRGGATVPGVAGMRINSNRDFAVYASAEGGPGEIIRSTDPIELHGDPRYQAYAHSFYKALLHTLSLTGEAFDRV